MVLNNSLHWAGSSRFSYFRDVAGGCSRPVSFGVAHHDECQAISAILRRRSRPQRHISGCCLAVVLRRAGSQ